MASNRGQHLIGKMLGSCVLEKLLGYGGSSAVFLAQQQDPQRKVAVKVFLPRAGMDIRMQRDFYLRFLREAEAVSKLEHANILPIYSYGEQDGLPYIVMPYMPGGTLSEYMVKRGPLSLKEARWYLEQLAAALDYAHAHGCVHCDVKPANILLDSEGHVVLSDFGIARAMQPELVSDKKDAKSAEAVMGTPDYISPEQALGRPLDGRSDVYSLGVTLFFVLVKRLPFRADSTIALALLHVHEPPPSLALLRADVSPLLDRVVRKALAKEPSERFQSAGDLSRAFSAAIDAGEKRSQPARSPELTPFESELDFTGPQTAMTPPRPVVRVKPLWSSPMKPSKGKRVLLALAAVLVVVVTASLTLIFMHNNSGPTAPPIVVQHSTATAIPTLMPNNPLQLIKKWPQSQNFFFDDNHQYHVKNTQVKSAMFARFRDYQVQDFKLSVTMLEVGGKKDGPDFHGVMFRTAIDQSFFYLFEISPYDDQQYAFLRFSDTDKQQPWKTITSGRSPAIIGDEGKSNTIIIVAKGNAFSFVINGTPLMEKPMVDPYATTAAQPGSIGLYVENQGVEVTFSNLSVDSFK
ncbi:hypothetical protein KDA_33580 [Dictyobacter alpinus]|uniref:non-specific serine/threonine protein kinase n=1 Tax=Dictyobacter alpinus TaxID=2014873 RepID=A0A402B924_9CHLR|nr:serine/threonine-protein kinase [Dictyobacter alpinus]GCE27874.1 hypothetical protein KDA_33580 [Dictyobacter alpinus]